MEPTIQTSHTTYYVYVYAGKHTLTPATTPILSRTANQEYRVSITQNQIM